MSRLPLLIPLALACTMAASPRPVLAQDALDVKAAALLRDAYLQDMDSAHVKLLALANAIPADKYDWRPGAGVRSVSEVLMHVASEWYFFGPMSIGGKAPADFLAAGQNPGEKLASLEKITHKTAVLAELDKSWAYNKAQLMAADPATLTGKYKPWGVSLVDAMLSMTDDQHEHLGQLIAYARSVGVKPPWSK